MKGTKINVTIVGYVRIARGFSVITLRHVTVC